MDLNGDHENDQAPVEPGEELDGEDLAAIDEITLHEGKCRKPQCKRIRVNLVYQRGLAATREGCFWIAIFAFFLLFVLGLLVVMWIFPSLIMRRAKNIDETETFDLSGERMPGLSFDPTSSFGTSFDDERHRNISKTFILEEAYPAIEARYFTFEKRANKSDASQVCSNHYSSLVSIDLPELDKSLHDFINKAYKELPFSSLGLLWTAGIISSDDPEIIQWGGDTLTFLNENDARLNEMRDGRLLWKNKDMQISIFKKFCNESEAIKAQLKSSSTPQLYEVLIDLRSGTRCWVVRRQAAKEENNFVCQASSKDLLRIYDSDPEFVGQTYSTKSGIFHKFFATRQPLIDARRICNDEESHLLTFSNLAEETDFDSRLRSLKGKVFVDEPNETAVNLFTSGWYLYSPTNLTIIHWGRGSAMSRYENFCDGEKKKADALFAQNPDFNRHFVILKSYTSSKEIEFSKSCWKLLSYREAKDSSVSNYFACQLKKK